MKLFSGIGFFLVVVLLVLGCRKDQEYLTSSNAQLAFSVDTVIFDTVFTTVGSTTKLLKVYNNNDQPVLLENVSLQLGTASSYRINVDGDPGVELEDIEIGAEDSIFVFVEVTVDPGNINNPFVIEDRIYFNLNGNQQEVLLAAWGQNAVFHYPTGSILDGQLQVSCLDEDGDCFNGEEPVSATWNNALPHVVYGYLIVDSGDHLTIEAGTQVHFHSGSGLWVLDDGSLTVEGEPNNRVVFQGDRLEHIYDDVPGQWDVIRVNEGTTDIEIKYAIIKNGIIGLQAMPLVTQDNPPNDQQPSENKLILENVLIQDHSSFGLWARNYQVEATNCIFANAGQSVTLLQGGGNYNFNHCTFTNYWSETTRNTPGFYMSNLYEDENGAIQGRSVGSSVIENSIFYGNNFEEFSYFFDLTEGRTAEVQFRNNLYKLDETNINGSAFFPTTGGIQQITNGNPNFVDPSIRDWHLMEGSIVINKGNSTLSDDYDGENNRFDGAPDLGALEFQP